MRSGPIRGKRCFSPVGAARSACPAIGLGITPGRSPCHCSPASGTRVGPTPWPASTAGRRRQAEPVWVHHGQRIPSSPAESWLSNGRQVLHFKPVIWERWQQEVDVTSGEWLQGQATPLLKRRQRLSRDQAVQLWRQRRADGWSPCPPQWQPPPPPRMVLRR